MFFHTLLRALSCAVKFGFLAFAVTFIFGAGALEASFVGAIVALGLMPISYAWVSKVDAIEKETNAALELDWRNAAIKLRSKKVKVAHGGNRRHKVHVVKRVRNKNWWQRFKDFIWRKKPAPVPNQKFILDDSGVMDEDGWRQAYGPPRDRSRHPRPWPPREE